MALCPSQVKEDEWVSLTWAITTPLSSDDFLKKYQMSQVFDDQCYMFISFDTLIVVLNVSTLLKVGLF